MCQDTGTAIVKGKKGQFVFTGGGDEAAIAARRPATRTRRATCATARWRRSTCTRRSNTGTNLPAEIKIAAVDGDAYKFLFIAKGGGSANKRYLYQETKALLNEATLLPWIFDKMQALGTAACPPYHLAVVIGGTSAEFAVETAKLASTHYLDTLPTDGLGRRPRLPRRRARGEGARRWPSRPASAPSSAASTSATTCASSASPATAPAARWRWPCRARPTARRWARSPRDGVFLEQLETDPARFLPEVDRRSSTTTPAVHIDLNRPMAEILAELSQVPGAARG